MEYLSTDKILIIDLAKGSVKEESLDEGLVSEKIGGIGITTYLHKKYEGDDPVIIGTGLLTGTTVPATASAQITAKSPVTGKLCHCPIIYKVGIEIKFSGYDYIVVKGTSPKPVYLWIHDGVADISDASEIWGKDVWESTDALRTLVGDDLLQTIMIGPAGEKKSNYAQVCYNHWSSPDRFGLGRLFGLKNLKGFAFRGMGLIEVAEAETFVSRSLEILKQIKGSGYLSKKGMGEMGAALGHADLTAWLAPVVHRHTADFFTPYATNTFLFLDEDPKAVKETKVKEPGILVSDLSALVALKKLGLSAMDAGRVLKACARYGIDPAAVAELSGKSTVADLVAAFDAISGTVTQVGHQMFSTWAPQKPIFNDFGLSGDTVDWWERRQAVAMIFGIHPLFALMSPELSDAVLLEMGSLGTELEISQETLDAVVDDICNS
ncbi:MAG: aldehyde ferredoxin oxidoreductase N-terminal domain-containing protein [Pseudomonadota bacterium]